MWWIRGRGTEGEWREAVIAADSAMSAARRGRDNSRLCLTCVPRRPRMATVPFAMAVRSVEIQDRPGEVGAS